MNKQSKLPEFQVKVKGSSRPVIGYRLSRITSVNPDRIELHVQPNVLRSKNPDDHSVTQGNAPYEVVQINDNGSIITVTPA